MRRAAVAPNHSQELLGAAIVFSVLFFIKYLLSRSYFFLVEYELQIGGGTLIKQGFGQCHGMRFLNRDGRLVRGLIPVSKRYA